MFTGFELSKIKSIYNNKTVLNEYIPDNRLNSLIQNNIGVSFTIDNYQRKTHGFINEMAYYNTLLTKYNKKENCYKIKLRNSPYGWGRIQAEDHSTLAVFHRPTRHSLCYGKYVDIDISSCCQNIFYNVIVNNGLVSEYPRLKQYIESRDELFQTYMDKYNVTKDSIKQMFTAIGFGGSVQSWFRTNNINYDNDLFINELNEEYYNLANIIYEANPSICQDILKAMPNKFSEYTNPHTLLSKKKRTTMALVYQTAERQCQETAIGYLCNKRGFNIKDIIPCQDGFMILEELMYPSICEDCSNAVKNVLKINLKFIVKEFDQRFEIPPYVCPKLVEKQEKEQAKQRAKDARLEKSSKRTNEINATLDTIESQKDVQIDKRAELEQEKQDRFNEFEETHLKIINKGVYLIEFPDKTLVKTKTQLVHAYEHVEGIKKIGSMGVMTVPFIDVWTCMNPNIRCKDDLDIFPPPLLVPENMYNLWKPFAGQLQGDTYTTNYDALHKIRNHIRILCNNDNAVAQYFELWIAQMIQYPAMKSNCPIIISKQGAGKGTLLQFLSQMIGVSKYHETTTPERDVWGSFNSIMTDCYLVNLNELSKQQTNDAMGIIKGLITDSALTINTKGVPQYKITSYHRWIITTNKDDPMPTQHDDRRFWIIRSSDELIGNKEYFNEMYALLKDPDVKATIFNYFNTLPKADTFSEVKMPNTEYQKNIQDGNISIPEKWLRDYVAGSTDDQVELLGQQIYQAFNYWKERNGVHYDINALKLTVQLSNMNIPGILKGRHTNKGNTKILDINILKRYFGIGCLVQFNSNDDV
jgi:hypothetical protein